MVIVRDVVEKVANWVKVFVVVDCRRDCIDSSQELFAQFDKEGLMAEAPYLAQTKNFSGFDLDHKFIGK